MPCRVRKSSAEQFWQLERCYKCSIYCQPHFLFGYRVPLDQTPEAVSSQIARLLKEEREKRSFSLNLLAEKAGVSRQTVAFIEQDLRNPTLNTLFRLTSALNVKPEEIIARARKRART